MALLCLLSRASAAVVRYQEIFLTYTLPHCDVCKRYDPRLGTGTDMKIADFVAKCVSGTMVLAILGKVVRTVGNHMVFPTLYPTSRASYLAKMHLTCSFIVKLYGHNYTRLKRYERRIKLWLMFC